MVLLNLPYLFIYFGSRKRAWFKDAFSAQCIYITATVYYIDIYNVN